jgi:hypothetical protein
VVSDSVYIQNVGRVECGCVSAIESVRINN